MCVPCISKTYPAHEALEEPNDHAIVGVRCGMTKTSIVFAFQRFGERWICVNCQAGYNWKQISRYAVILYPQQITLPKKHKDFTLRAWNHGANLHIVRNYETFCGRRTWSSNSRVVRQKDKSRKFPVCVSCQKVAIKKNFDLSQLVVEKVGDEE